MKRPTLLATGLVLLLAGYARAQSPVKIYLPRRMVLQAENLTVGDVCIVACRDETLLARVKAVSLGRGPLSRESLEIDRVVILSRLASNGIDRSGVTLTGAAQVQVRRPETHVEAQKVLQAAREAIKNTDQEGEELSWQVVSQAKDLYYPRIAGARIESRIEKSGSDSVWVVVEATSGRQVLASQKIEFRRLKEVQQRVATRDIPAGVPLTSENTRLRTIRTTGRSATETAALGQITRSRIAEGRSISKTMVRDFQAAPIVRRNQPVLMKIEGETFQIQAAGVALQDGKTGDIIQVRNIDSKQVVIARISEDGSVHPVIER